MSILDNLWIKITSSFVGLDECGNSYYESKNTDYLGRHRRHVVYKSVAEPSAVPPLFHAWLHHLIDGFPSTDMYFAWQKKHNPNATGTRMAYDPAPLKQGRKTVSADYSHWQPKE